jgi:membrane protease YdiL (CAAX protease family)
LNPPDPPSDPVDDPGSTAGGVETTQRLGTSTFTIEGRSAPGLFVVGWLATILGLASILTAILAGDPDMGRILLIVGMVLLALGLIAAAGSQGIERRARGRLSYQGPSPFLVLAASVPVAILALFLVSLPFALAGIALDGPFGALLSVTVQALVYVGLVRLLVVDGGALDWPSMGWSRFGPAAIVAASGGALWAVPVVLVTALLAAALVTAIPVEPISPLPPSGTTLGFGLSLVAGAIVAPLGEEILFRGFATTAWIQGRGIVPGLVLGALVFAFAHVITISGATAGEALGQAVVAFLGRLPVAFALGWIFVRRRTIWAPFGLHAAFNAILLIVAENAASST